MIVSWKFQSGTNEKINNRRDVIGCRTVSKRIVTFLSRFVITNFLCASMYEASAHHKVHSRNPEGGAKE
jgi:hypothetical protein